MFYLIPRQTCYGTAFSLSTTAGRRRRKEIIVLMWSRLLGGVNLVLTMSATTANDGRDGRRGVPFIVQG